MKAMRIVVDFVQMTGLKFKVEQSQICWDSQRVVGQIGWC